MDRFINFYKSMRKKRDIQKDYAFKYAFVGIGNHSLNNLYPIIDYLKIPLKYIVCKSEKTVNLVRQNYPSVIGTNDYEKVLNDPEINGIFICSSPSTHFDLTNKALSAQKNVFTEKPVCLSANELQQLIDSEKLSKGSCMVGMQKRFSTCTTLLTKRMKKENIISYNYRFLVGAYPEGNAFWDIFIHPLDLTNFLFGESEVVSALKTQSDKGSVSILLHLKHKPNIIGTVEISTQYAWMQAKEKLTVNTEAGVYEMDEHQQLTYSPKPKTIFSIPTEKFIPYTPETQCLFNGNNFLPIFDNNQLVSQGFFGEIQSFINLCEKKSTKNNASLSSLINTYKILENPSFLV